LVSHLGEFTVNPFLQLLMIMNRLNGLRADFHTELTTDWLLFQSDATIVKHIIAVRRATAFMMDDVENLRHDIEDDLFRDSMDAIAVLSNLIVFRLENAMKKQIASILN
jgi:hypothetical protein